MSGEVCTDNRFDVIERFKQRLIEATNIESDKEEMAVIDNILFRFYQLGWLQIIDNVKPEIKLKSCPFCGEKPKLKISRSYLSGKQLVNDFEVGCDKCNTWVRQRKNHINYSTWCGQFNNGTYCIDQSGLIDLINQWNRREDNG